MFLAAILSLVVCTPWASFDDECYVSFVSYNGLSMTLNTTTMEYEPRGAMNGHATALGDCCGQLELDWSFDNPFGSEQRVRWVLYENCYAQETVIATGPTMICPENGTLEHTFHAPDYGPYECNCSYRIKIELMVVILGTTFWVTYNDIDGPAEFQFNCSDEPCEEEQSGNLITDPDCYVYDARDEGGFGQLGPVNGTLATPTGCCGDISIDWAYTNHMGQGLVLRHVIEETCGGGQTQVTLGQPIYVPGGAVSQNHWEGLPHCDCDFSFRVQYAVISYGGGLSWLDLQDTDGAVEFTWSCDNELCG